MMTFDELIKAALDRRAVVGFHVHRTIPMPAAFVLSMPGMTIAHALPRLELYNRQEDNDAKA